MSTRTIIEINHDDIKRLDVGGGDHYLWHRLLMNLRTFDLSDSERAFLAARGIRVLAQRHHSDTITLKVE